MSGMNFSGSSPYFGVNFLGLDGLQHLDRDTEAIFYANLTTEVYRAVDAIIKNAKSQLVPGHGYDEGLLHDTLTKEIVADAMSTGVIYKLLSDGAYYWPFIEDGYTRQDGTFIEGLHFFREAVKKNHGRIGLAASMAWKKTSYTLSLKAAMPKGVKKLL